MIKDILSNIQIFNYFFINKIKNQGINQINKKY